MELTIAEHLLRRMRDFPRDFTVRERVIAVEAEMLKAPQLDPSLLPVFHHFAPGLYARELHIPKGALTTGKIHKYPCLNILAKGERSTLIGDEVIRLCAPHVHVTPAGSKRISYTHEDSVWITVHATTETDVAKLECDLVAESEEEYADFCRLIEAEAKPCLSSPARS